MQVSVTFSIDVEDLESAGYLMWALSSPQKMGFLDLERLEEAIHGIADGVNDFQGTELGHWSRGEQAGRVRFFERLTEAFGFYAEKAREELAEMGGSGPTQQ